MNIEMVYLFKNAVPPHSPNLRCIRPGYESVAALVDLDDVLGWHELTAPPSVYVPIPHPVIIRQN